jgi:hypothetical protein
VLDGADSYYLILIFVSMSYFSSVSKRRYPLSITTTFISVYCLLHGLAFIGKPLPGNKGYIRQDNNNKGYIPQDNNNKGYILQDNNNKGYIPQDNNNKGYIPQDNNNKGYIPQDNNNTTP